MGWFSHGGHHREDAIVSAAEQVDRKKKAAENTRIEVANKKAADLQQAETVAYNARVQSGTWNATALSDVALEYNRIVCEYSAAEAKLNADKQSNIDQVNTLHAAEITKVDAKKAKAIADIQADHAAQLQEYAQQVSSNQLERNAVIEDFRSKLRTENAQQVNTYSQQIDNKHNASNQTILSLAKNLNDDVAGSVRDLKAAYYAIINRNTQPDQKLSSYSKVAAWLEHLEQQNKLTTEQYEPYLRFLQAASFYALDLSTGDARKVCKAIENLLDVDGQAIDNDLQNNCAMDLNSSNANYSSECTSISELSAILQLQEEKQVATVVFNDAEQQQAAKIAQEVVCNNWLQQQIALLEAAYLAKVEKCLAKKNKCVAELDENLIAALVTLSMERTLLEQWYNQQCQEIYNEYQRQLAVIEQQRLAHRAAIEAQHAHDLNAIAITLNNSIAAINTQLQEALKSIKHKFTAAISNAFVAVGSFITAYVAPPGPWTAALVANGASALQNLTNNKGKVGFTVNYAFSPGSNFHPQGQQNNAPAAIGSRSATFNLEAFREEYAEKTKLILQGQAKTQHGLLYKLTRPVAQPLMSAQPLLPPQQPNQPKAKLHQQQQSNAMVKAANASNDPRFIGEFLIYNGKGIQGMAMQQPGGNYQVWVRSQNSQDVKHFVVSDTAMQQFKIGDFRQFHQRHFQQVVAGYNAAVRTKRTALVFTANNEPMAARFISALLGISTAYANQEGTGVGRSGEKFMQLPVDMSCKVPRRDNVPVVIGPPHGLRQQRQNGTVGGVEPGYNPVLQSVIHNQNLIAIPAGAVQYRQRFYGEKVEPIPNIESSGVSVSFGGKDDTKATFRVGGKEAVDVKLERKSVVEKSVRDVMPRNGNSNASVGCTIIKQTEHKAAISSAPNQPARNTVTKVKTLQANIVDVNAGPTKMQFDSFKATSKVAYETAADGKAIGAAGLVEVKVQTGRGVVKFKAEPYCNEDKTKCLVVEAGLEAVWREFNFKIAAGTKGVELPKEAGMRPHPTINGNFNMGFEKMPPDDAEITAASKLPKPR